MNNKNGINSSNGSLDVSNMKETAVQETAIPSVQKVKAFNPPKL